MLKHLKSSVSWQEKSLGAKGFTLIELLVVIVILGVLGAVVVFSVRGVANDSEDSACKTEKRTIATAVEAYYAANPSLGYPADLTALDTAGFLNDANDLVGADYSIDGSTGQVSLVGSCPA